MAAVVPLPNVPKLPRWPRTRWSEFLLVGGATLPLLLVAWILQRTLDLDETEYTVSYVAFYLAFVINDPHFAVTYFLFYRDAKRRALSPSLPLTQRLRYWAAGALAPLLLLGWSAFALHRRDAEAIGAMVQVMFLLVGWHYVKQGFGMVTVLSARRGVALTALERRALLTHCYAGWAYAWASPASAAARYVEKGVVYTSFAHPRWLELTTAIVFGMSTGVLLGVLGYKLWRERARFPFAPVVGFLITIWAWTIWSAWDPLLRYFIPALHSIQYLYFVWLMRKNEVRSKEGPPAFGRPVRTVLGVLALASLALGWVLFHGLPTFLDDAFTKRASEDTPMGPTPYFAALFVFVNVHHYCMDSVIWRRDNPDTRFLKDPQ